RCPRHLKLLAQLGVRGLQFLDLGFEADDLQLGLAQSLGEVLVLLARRPQALRRELALPLSRAGLVGGWVSVSSRFLHHVVKKPAASSCSPPCRRAPPRPFCGSRRSASTRRRGRC